MRDTAKDRGKYVVGMGKCVVLCVELCSCMLKGLLGVAKMRRGSRKWENWSSFSCLINYTRTRFAAIVTVHNPLLSTVFTIRVSL